MFDLTAEVNRIFGGSSNYPPGVSDDDISYRDDVATPREWEDLSDNEQDKIRNDFVNDQGISMVADLLEETDIAASLVIYRRLWAEHVANALSM